MKVMSNYDPPAAEKIASKIKEILINMNEK